MGDIVIRSLEGMDDASEPRATVARFELRHVLKEKTTRPAVANRVHACPDVLPLGSVPSLSKTDC